MRSILTLILETTKDAVDMVDNGQEFEFCISNSNLEFKFSHKNLNSGSKIQISGEKNEFLADRGGMGGSYHELDLNLDPNSLNTNNIGVIQTGEGEGKQISPEEIQICAPEIQISKPKRARKSKNLNFTPTNSAKIQILEYVWMLPKTRDSYIQKFGEPFFNRCAEKLNAWIGSMKDEGGAEFAKRVRNGLNAGHTMTSWVVNAVAEEQGRATKSKPKKSNYEQSMEILWGKEQC